VQEVRIRSVLTCATEISVCGKCYGRDLARGTKVNIGEAVGVIAAQSIGEPGTQLTMRTFHIGGVAQTVDTSFIESNFNGIVRIKNRNLVKDSQGRLIVMGRNVAIAIEDLGGKELARAHACCATRATLSSAARVWRNGTPSRVRSSPRSTVWSASRTLSKVPRCASRPTK
jgi:DNA-directed RNA polymerase subunit beta'